MNINYSGMILAAGFGKRMMPLTKNIPKPLIEINGVTLLGNSIDFLNKLGCKEIIINTHYHHELINKFVEKRHDKKKIKIIFEKEILDTAGGVKNAITFFSTKSILVINSDIYWQKNNLIDAKLLIKSFSKNNKAHLLLSKWENSFGIDKKTGDFVIINGKICRFSNGDEIIYYSGMQILELSVFKKFNNKKFSFNNVWDHLIYNDSLYGEIMNSDWYHVGDIQGLNIAKKLDT